MYRLLSDELLNLPFALVMFLGWTALACGCGRGVLKMLAPQYVRRVPWWNLFWWGWGGIIGFLQVAHLFVPVRLTMLPPLVAFAVYGYLGTPRSIRFPPARLALQGALILAALYISRQPYSNYDTALYHLNLIRWQTTHPLFPGLGHFNFQLALNQSYYLWGSLLRLDPLDLPIRPFLNTTLWWVAVQPSLRCVSRLFRNHRLPNRDLLPAVMFPLWLFVLVYQNLHNPTNDALVTLLTLKLVESVPMIARWRHGTRSSEALLVFWLAFWLLTAKLTAFGLCAGMGAWLGYRLLKGWRTRGGIPSAWFRVAAVLLVSGIVYLIRGWMMSGIPLYPAVIPPESTWAPWAIRGTEVLHDGQRVMSRMQSDTGVVMEIAHMWYRAAAGEPPNPPFDLNAPEQVWNQHRYWLPMFAVNFWKYANFRWTAPLILVLGLLLPFRFRRWRGGIALAAGFCVLQILFLVQTGPYVRFLSPVMWALTATLLALHLPAGPGPAARLIRVGLFGLWCGGWLGVL
ncbi:MAG: hypothetical protein PF795_09860, partial [Kiritimatiellae bacterium]|nr:hypothetical protein [Kiritimatiellia bacterium]